MKAIEQLKELLQAEVDLVEAMTGTLQFQQQAIIYYNLDSLNEGVLRQRNLLEPLNALETERTKIVGSVIEEYGLTILNDENGEITISRIAQHLPVEDAGKINELGSRLRSASEKVVQLNKENERLIVHTQKYIRENVKILTENFSRQLVDQKI